MSSEPLPTASTALLRHEPRDGPMHYDWLVEVAIPIPEVPWDLDARVPTFRLPARLDTRSIGTEIDAERIADHRRLYLELDVPRELSEGRGLVTPLRRGSIVAFERDGITGEVRIEIDWRDDQPTRQRVRLTPRTGDRWSIAVLGVE